MAKKNDIFEVEVIGWERLQTFKNGKPMRWFKLYGDIFSNPKIANLTAREFKLYIYLLSTCCQQGSNKIALSTHLVRMLNGLSTHLVRTLICNLEELQLVRADLGALEKSREEKSREEKRRDAQRPPKGADSATVKAVDNFDFNALYQKYPRKIGKKRGLAVCKNQIKTKKLYGELALAIDNYSRYVELQNISLRYIKHFSSFMGEWQDWVEVDEGLMKRVPESRAEKVSANNKALWDKMVAKKEIGGAGD